MGFRNYDPGLNSFLSRDMYNGALADLSLGMDPWNANRYAFAGGNPISHIELDGHEARELDRVSMDTTSTPPSDAAPAPPAANSAPQVLCDSSGLRCGIVSGWTPSPEEPTTSEARRNVAFAYLLGAAVVGCTLAPEACAAGALESVPGAEGAAITGAAGAGIFEFERDVERILGRGTAKATEEGGGKLLWTSWQNYPKVEAGGQTYAKIGDRLYSKHAVDRMQPSGLRYSPRPGPTEGGSTGGMPQIFQAGGDYGRSVSPNFIEDVIAGTRGVPQENGNILYDGGGLQVILSPEGRVVTVMTQ